MRILFVLPELPHPPFTGAHTRPLYAPARGGAARTRSPSSGLLPPRRI